MLALDDWLIGVPAVQANSVAAHTPSTLQTGACVSTHPGATTEVEPFRSERLCVLVSILGVETVALASPQAAVGSVIVLSSVHVQLMAVALHAVVDGVPGVGGEVVASAKVLTVSRRERSKPVPPVSVHVLPLPILLG